MKTRDEFVDDIFSKVSKRDAMFSFKDRYVVISFKYETDLMLAYNKLKDKYVCARYGMTLRVSCNENI